MVSYQLSGHGLFVTIEGIEGSGKTTLASGLGRELTAAGREAVVTAEPGGGGVGDLIRALLLDPANVISDRAELLLFEAARAYHVDTRIRPDLERGAVVICDRYTDSSIAYQGFARGIDEDAVRLLNDFATAGLKPDITLLLDIPVDDGLARQERLDRISSEALEFHGLVRQGYLALATNEPERFVVIDARQPADAVLRQAREAIAQRFDF